MTHKLNYTLAELAKLLSAELVGDGQVVITGLATLQNASSGQLSFFSNPFYADQLKTSQASAILVEEKYLDRCSGNKLVTEKPYVAFALATQLFDNSPRQVAGIHDSACVDASAQLGENVSIAPNVVIEANVKLGNDVVIGAGCVIGQNSQHLGDCSIRPSSLHRHLNCYRYRQQNQKRSNPRRPHLRRTSMPGLSQTLLSAYWIRLPLDP